MRPSSLFVGGGLLPGGALRYGACLLGIHGACLLWAPDALAHGDHPHPPGEATEHTADEAPPPAPVDEEGTPKTPKAKTVPEPGPAPGPEPSAGDPLPPPAVADDEGWRPRTLDDSGWRRRVRDQDKDAEPKWVEPSHFHIELRFGPYSPNVDDEPGAGGAYAKYFGTDPNFYFGLEADWLPLYIPYVGSLGPGFGWGVTVASGQAKVQGTNTDAASDTSLTIFPMYLVGVFRADGILRELHIPIVPYIKGGVGFGLWSASGPNENGSARDPGGTSVGVHFALGGAIALNAFDRASAKAMYEATGIRYANLFGEWMLNDLGGGSDDQLLVGTSTVVLGIALDF